MDGASNGANGTTAWPTGFSRCAARSSNIWMCKSVRLGYEVSGNEKDLSLLAGMVKLISFPDLVKTELLFSTASTRKIKYGAWHTLWSTESSSTVQKPNAAAVGGNACGDNDGDACDQYANGVWDKLQVL